MFQYSNAKATNVSVKILQQLVIKFENVVENWMLVVKIYGHWLLITYTNEGHS